MDFFDRYLVRRERRIFWFNIHLLSFIHRNDAWWRACKFPSLWFCFPFDRAAKSFTFSCDACSSGRSSGLSAIMLFESITNLFDPMRTSNHMSECCLRSETKFWFQLRVYHTSNWSILPARVQFSCFPGSILLVVMIHLPLEECIHDKPLHKIVLRCLSSWNTVHFPQHFLILHPCKIYSLYLSVKDLIHSSYSYNRKFWYAGSSFSKRTSVLISQRTIHCPITTHQVALIDREGIHILHTCLRLLRKNRADWQRQLCEKVSHDPQQNESTVFRVLCFWAYSWTMEL